MLLYFGPKAGLGERSKISPPPPEPWGSNTPLPPPFLRLCISIGVTFAPPSYSNNIARTLPKSSVAMPVTVPVYVIGKPRYICNIFVSHKKRNVLHKVLEIFHWFIFFHSV